MGHFPHMGFGGMEDGFGGKSRGDAVGNPPIPKWWPWLLTFRSANASSAPGTMLSTLHEASVILTKVPVSTTTAPFYQKS